jgi:hypothetical protein
LASAPIRVNSTGGILTLLLIRLRGTLPANPERVYFTRNLFLCGVPPHHPTTPPPHHPASPVRTYRKALLTTFLPSVKTLAKNILFVFLLAQVFFFTKRKSVA